MAADKTLARSGLYFDELNKIRVLEPEVAQQTTELRDECKGFVDSEFFRGRYLKELRVSKKSD